MFTRNISKRAQTLVEYAVIIAAVAAAVGAMGIIFKSALQKRILSVSKELNSQPYAPTLTTSSGSSSATSSVNETYSQGISTTTSNETTARTSTETVTYETQ